MGGEAEMQITVIHTRETKAEKTEMPLTGENAKSLVTFTS